MHYLHTEILTNLEHGRITDEAEVHFQRLREAGIEPGTSRKSMLSWLHTDRHSTALTHRPRPV